MGTPFKMKGFGGFGNSPMKAKTKTSSTQEDAPEKKRTITSNLKTKEKEPDWMANSSEIQAKKYADEKYNAAVNRWEDGDMGGNRPKRSDFNPTW